MTEFLNTDEYVKVNRNCPIRTDLHPADNFVEITFGDDRSGESTLRLVVAHPDTLLRMSEAIGTAHVKLVKHLDGKPDTEPTPSEEDVTTWTRTGS
ncbi:hypothetical protein [Actinophytocola sp. KF-1]